MVCVVSVGVVLAVHFVCRIIGCAGQLTKYDLGGLMEFRVMGMGCDMMWPVIR